MRPGLGLVRSLGGKKAKPHSRPYIAYLSIRHGNRKYICGGFLVAENFVLTAAHCNGDEIIVKLGAHNIRLWEWKRQKIPVCHWIPHPQYDKKPHNNDIMLLQLVKRDKLNRRVKTIDLPCANETGDSGGPLICGQTAQDIISWGSEDGIPPGVYTSVSTFIPWIQEMMKRLQP
nr:granzyme-like protein 1 [Chrysemys picta bellii]